MICSALYLPTSELITYRKHMLNTKTLIKYAPQLFTLLFVANMIDAATTATLIHWGGLEVEVNPFMRAIIANYGTYGMVVYKCLAIVFFWFMYDVVKKFKPQLLRCMTLALTAVCVVYTLLAIHNIGAVYYVWLHVP